MNLDAVKMLASTAVGMIDGSALGPLEGYTGSSAGTLGMALLILGEQLDGAAAHLTEENAALRRLFEGSAARVGGDLGARLSGASAATDDDLRVHALQTTNDALRALLIELHVWTEAAGTAEVELDRAIWQELRRSTERRQVGLGPF